MTQFALKADISTEDAAGLFRQIVARFGADAVTETPTGFRVECMVSGGSARDLNRELLSDLRRTVKKTRLRAVWTANGVSEKFFDYVPKGTSSSD